MIATESIGATLFVWMSFMIFGIGASMALARGQVLKFECPSPRGSEAERIKSPTWTVSLPIALRSAELGACRRVATQASCGCTASTGHRLGDLMLRHLSSPWKGTHG